MVKWEKGTCARIRRAGHQQSRWHKHGGQVVEWPPHPTVLTFFLVNKRYVCFPPKLVAHSTWEPVHSCQCFRMSCVGVSAHIHILWRVVRMKTTRKERRFDPRFLIAVRFVFSEEPFRLSRHYYQLPKYLASKDNAWTCIYCRKL